MHIINIYNLGDVSLKIKKWMKRNVNTIQETANVFDAAVNMKDNFVSSLIVVVNGQPLGIVTERDIVYKAVALDKPSKETKVSDVMTKTLIKANINDSVAEVSRRMGLAKIKQIPIVDEDNTLVGIVTSTDLVRVISHFQKDMDAITGK